MEQLTVGDIHSFITLVAGLITGGAVIYAALKKVFEKGLSDGLKPVNDKLDGVGKKIAAVAFDNAKNFVVSFLSKVEDPEQHPTPEETERFWENYDQYVHMGGNSYVHRKVEELKAKGKL